MDTLFTDLFGLIDNYLDITQAILLRPNHVINELNQSKDIKVWLHLYKKNEYQAIKILYKKRDLRTLQFINKNICCRRYIQIIQLYRGLISINDPDLFETFFIIQLDISDYKKIVKYICKHGELEFIKKLQTKNILEKHSFISILWKYAYKYECTEIINYVKSIYNRNDQELFGIISGSSGYGFELVDDYFKQPDKKSKQYIIRLCLEHQNYNLLSLLLNEYDGHDSYTKCLTFLTKTDSYTQSFWAFLYSLQHDNDSFTLSLLDIVLNHKKCKLLPGELLFKSIKHGANDNIIDVILQKYPNDAKILYILRFLEFNKLNPRFTARSLKNIEVHRGGFTKEDLNTLSATYIQNGRYDLLTALC